MIKRAGLVLAILMVYLPAVWAQCGSSCNCIGNNPSGKGLAPERGNFIVEFKTSFRQYQPLTSEQLVAGATADQQAYSMQSQQTFGLSMAYGISNRFSLYAFMPYNVTRGITQGHVHDDGIGQAHQFGNVKGEGDAALLINLLLLDKGIKVVAGAGCKFPTGLSQTFSSYGIDVPMKLQPGSGSFEPVFALAAQKRRNRLEYRANAFLKYGTSAMGHSMGNLFSVNGNVYYSFARNDSTGYTPLLSLKLMAGISSEITGRMSNHETPDGGHHHHVTSPVDPNTGGSITSARGGAIFAIGKHLSVPLNFSLPIFQQHNGVQPRVSYMLEAGITLNIN